MLRLHEGKLFCVRCLQGSGIRFRSVHASIRQRAIASIPRLKAKLNSKVKLRRGLWGTMANRKSLEAALARNEYIVTRARFKWRVKDDAVQT